MKSKEKIIKSPLHVRIKISSRAKRLGLRVDSKEGGFLLNVPQLIFQRRDFQKNIDRFLLDAQPWMAKQNSTARQCIVLKPDLKIPFQGRETKLVQLKQIGPCSTVHIGDEIQVSGPKHFFHQQLVAFFRKKSGSVFKDTCINFANKLPKTVLKKPILFQRFSIKDTKSRWGSCSSRGSISLSWRLILAPEKVARYVCIHEVCHLLEMNHSTKFWALVEHFDPDFKEHRAWLKTHGRELHIYDD